MAGLESRALRTASLNWRCIEASWTWYRAILPVLGCGQRVAEGNRYCQGHSREALGYFLGFGHVNVPASAREIVGVLFAFFGEVVFQPGFQGAGKRDDPVLRALSVVDDDGSLAEIDVFDAQAEGFHEAEA